VRIIYLHGFASGPGSRKAQYFRERFAERDVRIEIPHVDQGDFRGLTITGQLRLIESLAAGEPVQLIGSSMGGYVAALYAARHPETERLVLLAPAFYFTERWPQTLGAPVVEAWKRKGSMPVFHYAEGATREIGYQLVEDGAQYPGAPDFHQPTLIFHGTKDTVVPASYSEEFVAAHPNAHLQLLDSGHELTDCLDVIWNEAVSFLQQEQGRVPV
jgi:pimeloyl-ACP methyl ester carboxylesterase